MSMYEDPNDIYIDEYAAYIDECEYTDYLRMLGLIDGQHKQLSFDEWKDSKVYAQSMDCELGCDDE